MKPALRTLIVFTTLAMVASLRLEALPDAEAAAGRVIVRRYADAIVVVKATVTLKVNVGDRVMPPNENKIDVNGTMITPAGLTVTSLSAIDPRTIFETMRSQTSASVMAVELEQSDVKGLRLLLTDGKEVPAKVVWKDAARDLALLAPEGAASAGGRTFTFVNLNEAPEAAVVLGNYYHLSRLGDTMQRTPIMRPSTVNGIIERPRRLLLISTDSFNDAVGCPVFDPQGRVLGICLHYMVNGLPKGTVVVPAADVAEVVSQMTVL
ncbi:MAG: serine protease [Opitutaceae bacterium]|jgi:S1-C subfamily serine protease